MEEITLTLEPVDLALINEGLKEFLRLTDEAIKVSSGQQLHNLKIQSKMIKSTMHKVLTAYEPT